MGPAVQDEPLGVKLLQELEGEMPLLWIGEASLELLRLAGMAGRATWELCGTVRRGGGYGFGGAQLLLHTFNDISIRKPAFQWKIPEVSRPVMQFGA